jgi:hypothetical protein
VVNTFISDHSSQPPRFGIILDSFVFLMYTIMKIIYIISILLCSLVCSCSEDKIKTDPDNLIFGIWTYSDYQDNASIYSRNQKFINDHCYKFNPDGTLAERKNSGWCGTPPISYADYDGTWTVLNDTLIQINVGYWGGTITYNLDIEKLDSHSLKVATIYLE